MAEGITACWEGRKEAVTLQGCIFCIRRKGLVAWQPSNEYAICNFMDSVVFWFCVSVSSRTKCCYLTKSFGHQLGLLPSLSRVSYHGGLCRRLARAREKWSDPNVTWIKLYTICKHTHLSSHDSPEGKVHPSRWIDLWLLSWVLLRNCSSWGHFVFLAMPGIVKYQRFFNSSAFRGGSCHLQHLMLPCK